MKNVHVPLSEHGRSFLKGPAQACRILIEMLATNDQVTRHRIVAEVMRRVPACLLLRKHRERSKNYKTSRSLTHASMLKSGAGICVTQGASYQIIRGAIISTGKGAERIYCRGEKYKIILRRKTTKGNAATQAGHILLELLESRETVSRREVVEEVSRRIPADLLIRVRERHRELCRHPDKTGHRHVVSESKKALYGAGLCVSNAAYSLSRGSSSSIVRTGSRDSVSYRLRSPSRAS